MYQFNWAILNWDIVIERIANLIGSWPNNTTKTKEPLNTVMYRNVDTIHRYIRNYCSMKHRNINTITTMIQWWNQCETLFLFVQCCSSEVYINREFHQCWHKKFLPTIIKEENSINCELPLTNILDNKFAKKIIRNPE